MSSDAWSSIQEHKKKLDHLREKLQKRRARRQEGDVIYASIRNVDSEAEPLCQSDTKFDRKDVEPIKGNKSEALSAVVEQTQPDPIAAHNDVKKHENAPTALQRTSGHKSGKPENRRKSEKSGHKRSRTSESSSKPDSSRHRKHARLNDTSASAVPDELDDLQALLSTKSAKEQDSARTSDELQELLSIASTKELSLAEQFRSMDGPQVREFCLHATREVCLKNKKSFYQCKKLHFRKILKPHTDESLGDCSFLNTCFHMDTCKYVHYEIDYRGTGDRRGGGRRGNHDSGRGNHHHGNSGMKLATDEEYLSRKMLPPQWINCDIRYLDVSILGKFSVIMADPPWDIHMELPYGTMQDTEMRALRIQDLSDDGLIFLWVTGRAMELGRELFEYWGYKRCDELIWVKTNQLQRLIRTGRTGHWMNHGKEHCLIGIKGNPENINKRLDCDVLVAEVRDTSHKPDEIYGIIERLSPGTRKLELFGRMHNFQPNWVTLGNQLDGVHLVEYDMVQKFTSKYPDGIVTKPSPVVKQPPANTMLPPPSTNHMLLPSNNMLQPSNNMLLPSSNMLPLQGI